MAEININPSEVRKAAANLRNCSIQIKEKTRTFNNIEDEIESSWKSNYTRQYLNILENTEAGVERTARSLDTIASNLEKIASSVEKAEAEIQRKLAAAGSSSGGGFRGSSGGGGGGGW